MRLLSATGKFFKHVDVNDYLDNLLTDFYQFQYNGLVFICGDFNSRCGDLEDFIVGIDDIVSRSVKDFKLNLYGERFIEFLISTNMCMLNGRVDNDQDNFTLVSTQGSAVVDYCIVTHSNFSQFSDFRVTCTNNKYYPGTMSLHVFRYSGSFFIVQENRNM